MKIAVLMSSYNGERYIKTQIESVLAQEVDAQVDLWVRDDGSADATRDILQQYADEGKLRWYTGENLKPAKSFLDLVKHCPGYDYYAYCDQDDYWHPDKLRCGIALLKDKAGPAMCFANARLVDAQLKDLGRSVYNRTPRTDFYSVTCGGGILGCTVMFNGATGALLQACSGPEKLIMHDSYTAIVCTLFGGVIEFDPQPHMDYRQHGTNAVGTNWTKWDALKDRLNRVTTREVVTIAEMAQSILDGAPEGADPEKLAFLHRVADYPKRFRSALSLALSSKPKFNGPSMELTMRLAIVLRNR